MSRIKISIVSDASTNMESLQIIDGEKFNKSLGKVASGERKKVLSKSCEKAYAELKHMEGATVDFDVRVKASIRCGSKKVETDLSIPGDELGFVDVKIRRDNVLSVDVGSYEP